MTEVEVGMLLSVLSTAYPPMKVTPEVVAGWHFLLKKDPPGPVMAALERLLRDRVSTFPPAVGEILHEAYSADVPTAEHVYEEIHNAIQSVGYIRVPNLSPLSNAVVNTIGWQTLCASENPEANRAHILRIAETFRKRVISGGIAAIAGHAQHKNPPLIEDVIESRRREFLKALSAGGGA